MIEWIVLAYLIFIPTNKVYSKLYYFFCVYLLEHILYTLIWLLSAWLSDKGMYEAINIYCAKNLWKIKNLHEKIAIFFFRIGLTLIS